MALMKKTSYAHPILYFVSLAAIILLCGAPSCGSTDCKDPKNASSLQCIPADVISCAAAEAKLVSDGKDVIEIALDIGTKVTAAYEAAKAAGGDTTAAIEAVVATLFTTYGEPIVACVLHDQAPVTSPNGPVTSAPSPFQLSVKSVLDKHAWKFAPPPGSK